jgi:hypothetical protein
VQAASGARAGKVVEKVRTDAHGGFAMALPSGSYSVYAVDCPQMAMAITVHAGKLTRVQVEDVSAAARSHFTR